MTKLHATIGVLVAVIIGLVLALIVRTDDTVALEGDVGGPLPEDIIRAERIARTIWGGVCNGEVALSVAPLGASAGHASWIRPADGKPFRSCVVIVNSKYSDVLKRCAIVVHEVGHLAGQRHSRDPESIMFPRITDRNIPDRCRR